MVRCFPAVAAFVAALALGPSFAQAQEVDVTTALCASVGADLAANPEKWPSVDRLVTWSHGYTVAANGKNPGFDYKAVDAFMKDLSAGKCPNSGTTLFASVRPLVDRKVADDDAWDLTAVTCGEWFTENTEDNNGRLDEVALSSDIAWLDGYLAARRQAPPRADFSALVTTGQLVFDKCKANPRLNLMTVFQSISTSTPSPSTTEPSSGSGG